jgi:hypothetical protein
MANPQKRRRRRISFCSDKLHLVTQEMLSTLLIYCAMHVKRGAHYVFYFDACQLENIQRDLSENLPSWRDIFTVS